MNKARSGKRQKRWASIVTFGTEYFGKSREKWYRIEKSFIVKGGKVL
jgi:hypothetical protein